MSLTCLMLAGLNPAQGPARAGATPAQETPSPFAVRPNSGHPGDEFALDDAVCSPSDVVLSFARQEMRPLRGWTFEVPNVDPGVYDVRYICAPDIVDVAPRARAPLQPGSVTFTVLAPPALFASVEPTTARPGEVVTVSGEGCEERHRLDVTIGGVEETVVHRGETFSSELTVPQIAAGSQPLVVRCHHGPDIVTEAPVAFTVASGPTTTSSTTTTTTTTTTVPSTTSGTERDGSPTTRDDAGLGGGHGRDDPAPFPTTTVPVPGGAEPKPARPTSREPDRPAFVTALATPDEVSFSTPLVAVNLVATVGIVLIWLLGFPSEPFDDALEAWLSRTKSRMPRCGRAWQRLRRRPIMLVAFGIAAAVVTTAAEPDVALNRSTIGLFVGLAVAITLTTAVARGPAAFWGRWSGRGRIEVRPYAAGLVLAAGLAAVGRLVGWQPTYVYGLIAAVELAAHRPEPDPDVDPARRRGHAALAGGVALLVLAVAAWFGWARVDQMVADQGSFPALVLDATLAALVVAGLTSLTIGYLPLRFMDGEALFGWNKGAWVAVWGASLFLTLQILANEHASQELIERGIDVALWVPIALFIVFGAATVALRHIVANLPPAPALSTLTLTRSHRR
jgi:hypothetical protein